MFFVGFAASFCIKFQFQLLQQTAVNQTLRHDSSYLQLKESELDGFCNDLTQHRTYDVASGRYKNHQVQILSTEGMMNHVSKSDSQQFVVATETGILYRMRQQNPQKTFIPASENAECEYMKMITLDKVYRSLYDEKYEVKVAKRIADKARLAIERMLSIS